MKLAIAAITLTTVTAFAPTAMKISETSLFADVAIERDAAQEGGGPCRRHLRNLPGVVVPLGFFDPFNLIRMLIVQQCVGTARLTLPTDVYACCSRLPRWRDRRGIYIPL